MANEIDEFRSVIGKHAGFAKNNRFRVIVSPPSLSLVNLDLGSLATSLITGSFTSADLVNDPRDLNILLEACSFPGRQIQTMEYSLFRNLTKFPTTFLNDDVTMTFHVTNDNYMVKLLQNWQDLALPRDTHLLNYPNKFWTEMVIQQLDQEGNVMNGIVLTDSWPVSIASRPLENGNDGTSRVTATFTFNDFQTESGIVSKVRGLRNRVTGTLRNLL